ncbi:MAG: hypothetical protein M3Z75_17910 [Actinomycetota bacterium]|nr:hypothetical protein [Actinomycetota bacterium]
MSTGHGREPAPGTPGNHARQYLADLAAILTAGSIPCRFTGGGAPTLTIEQPGAAPNPAVLIIDPGNGPGFWIDCICNWTPAPGATPEATAAAIITAVLNAIHPCQDGREPRCVTTTSGR